MSCLHLSSSLPCQHQQWLLQRSSHWTWMHLSSSLSCVFEEEDVFLASSTTASAMTFFSLDDMLPLIFIFLIDLLVLFASPFTSTTSYFSFSSSFLHNFLRLHCHSYHHYVHYFIIFFFLIHLLFIFSMKCLFSSSFPFFSSFSKKQHDNTNSLHFHLKVTFSFFRFFSFSHIILCYL